MCHAVDCDRRVHLGHRFLPIMQSELVLDDASPLNFGRQPVGRFATIRRVITNKGGLHINFLVKHANTGEGRCEFMGTRACVCVWLSVCLAVCVVPFSVFVLAIHPGSHSQVASPGLSAQPHAGTIEPGASMPIEFVFRAINTSMQLSPVTIETDSTQPLTLRMLGGGGLPKLSLSHPHLLDFGRCMLNRSLHKSIRLENTGNADLVVDEAVLHSGRASDGAGLAAFGKGAGWTETPFTVREGQSLTLPFVFRPTVEQPYSTVFTLKVTRAPLVLAGTCLVLLLRHRWAREHMQSSSVVLGERRSWSCPRILWTFPPVSWATRIKPASPFTILAT